MESLRSLLRLDRDKKRVPLIERLKRDNLPVIMWGAGTMARDIVVLLANGGVKLSGIWVDGEHPDTMNGIPIWSYEQTAEKFRRFNVVCGHSRFDLVESAEKTHNEINKIYCFVNVVYEQWNTISSEFIEEHFSEYEKSFNLLEDDLSRRCFAAYLNCRNNEDYTFLLPFFSGNTLAGGGGRGYFNNPFFKVGSDEVYLDVGAYNGDSVKEFAEAVGGHYRRILALEPEKNNFAELKKYVEESGLHDIEIFSNGCGESNGAVHFTQGLGAESLSVDDEGTCEMEVRRIDEQFASEEITLIKINFMTGVTETLRGAEKILQTRKPNLAVTVGFNERGIIDIPATIKEINPEIKLSLRYSYPMPARLVLYGY